MDHEFILEEFRYFHDGFIVFTRCFPEFVGEDGNARVNVVMKGENVVSVGEIPGNGIEIVFFAIEVDLEIVGENIRHFVKSFEAAIIVDDGFRAAEIGA